MMKSIEGKNILFIGTNFYYYEKVIINQFEIRGAKVFYFSSVINTLIKKLLVRLSLKKMLDYYVAKVVSKNIEQSPTDIDYIFVIKGENLRESHFKQLGARYPGIPKILYLWDSLDNLRNAELLFNQFDSILTFDRKDAEKYDLIFRPLFYRNKTHSDVNAEYDISFVGGAHSIRYNVVSQLKSLLDKNGIKYKIVLVAGKFDYYKRLLNREIKYRDRKLFVKHKISYEEYISIGLKSNVIFDIPDPSQTGLTIRSIETLGLGRKLLTTNLDIRNYGFPNSFFCIFDPMRPELSMQFIKNHDMEQFDISHYSIESFVHDIISSFPPLQSLYKR